MNAPAAASKVYVGTGFYWPVIVGLVVAAALVALILQNTHLVEVHWLWLDFTAPLVVVVLATIVASAVIVEAVGWRWRRQRRKRLAEREELRRLKHGQKGS